MSSRPIGPVYRTTRSDVFSDQELPAIAREALAHPAGFLYNGVPYVVVSEAVENTMTLVLTDGTPPVTVAVDEAALVLRQWADAMRDLSPLGGRVPVELPVVVRRVTKSHGGGRGVFASEAIVAGHYLGEYRGRVVDGAFRARSRVEADYAVEVPNVGGGRGTITVVGFPPNCSSWCRYINHPNARETANVCFEPYDVGTASEPDVRLFVCTTAAIPKQAQLLLDYQEKCVGRECGQSSADPC